MRVGLVTEGRGGDAVEWDGAGGDEEFGGEKVGPGRGEGVDGPDDRASEDVEEAGDGMERTSAVGLGRKGRDVPCRTWLKVSGTARGCVNIGVGSRTIDGGTHIVLEARRDRPGMRVHVSDRFLDGPEWQGHECSFVMG